MKNRSRIKLLLAGAVASALLACALLQPGGAAFDTASAACAANPDVQAAAKRAGVPAAELCDLVLRAAASEASRVAEGGGVKLYAACDGGDAGRCPL